MGVLWPTPAQRQRSLPIRPPRVPGEALPDVEQLPRTPVWITYVRRDPRPAVLLIDKGARILARPLGEGAQPVIVSRERIRTR